MLLNKKWIIKKMETIKLTVSNFHQFAFKPTSPKLSSRDKKIALAVSGSLLLTFGAGHLICGILNKVKKVNHLNEKPAQPAPSGEKKVTASDWQIEPMPKQKAFIPVDLKFTKKEFEKIKMGHIPEEMEDKWFVYSEDGHVYFHRSWTGNRIFDCLFEEKGDEVKITGFYVNRNLEQYKETSKEKNIELLDNLLKIYSH